MAARKLEPEVPPAKSARERRGELEVERRAITEKILALEAQGFLPSATGDPSRAIHDRALRLITGDDTAVVSGPDGSAELQALYDERAAIDKALGMLTQQEAVEETARLRRLMADEQPQWMAAVRKRALAAVALQHANQEFEQIRRRYRQLGSSLPSVQFKLLGFGGADEVAKCCNALVAAGILTKKEAQLDD